MASSNSPSDSWLQFYQQTTPPATSSMTLVADSTVVSATVSTTGSGQQGSRPIRRRSRASRRTPTTVLNTDPTNFRAMVQQFTGGYANATQPYPVQVSPSLYSLQREGPGLINFGVENGIQVTREQQQQTSSPEMAYRLYLQQQLQQQQQQQRQDGQDSNGAFLMDRIRSFGSDVENNEPFGRQ